MQYEQLEDSMLLAPAAKAPSKSEGRIAWACYFLLGAGMLAAWNAFITAADYFQVVYPSWHMDRLFTVCYLPPCLLMLLFMLRFPYWLSPRTRILNAFLGFTVILVVVPVTDILLVSGKDEGGHGNLAVLIVASLMVGLLDGFCQGAIFGDAAQLSPRLTQAVVGGTSCSGVIMSLLRIVTRALWSDTRAGLRASTAVYFYLAAALTFATMMVHAQLVPRLDIIRFYRSRAEVGNNVLEMSRYNADDDVMALYDESQPRPAVLDEFTVAPDVMGQDHELLPAARRFTWRRLWWSKVWAGLKKVWQPAMSLLVIYIVTLGIFPGFLAEDIHSKKIGTWYPILLITTFNVADMVGKNLPVLGVGRWRLPFLRRSALAYESAAAASAASTGILSEGRTLLWSCSRVMLVPCFLLAALLGAPPAIMWLPTVVLGLSNGYLTTCAMTLGHGVANNSTEADLAENLLVVALVVGLNVGAFTGWLWLL